MTDGIYKRVGKRALDVSAAATVLCFSAPIFILVSALLAWSNAGKVFFVQRRPGYGGKPFNVLKFKTMNDAVDADGELLSDAERMTPVGRIVRKTSLDELPQLINVLRGEMSLVGPRPLLIEYLTRYTPYQSRRHELRPGITGLAQVKGRNAVSWENRFRYDVFYVNHLSFLFDLVIIWWTLRNVLTAEGVGHPEEKFMGPRRPATQEIFS